MVNLENILNSPSRFSDMEVKDLEVKSMIFHLHYECSQYMKEEELFKIDTAVALMTYGHQKQFRENGDPYISHLLKVAIPLVKKFQVDWESVSSALCHDLLEDSEKNGFPVTFTDLTKFLSRDVASTVNTLSKVRFGDIQVREKYVDDVTRAELFKSLRDNPRAALIKIFDRLHNMQTIADMQDESVRKEKAYETLKYYVPLAQFLGIFDEARELARLSLAVIDPEFTEKLLHVLDDFEKSVSLEMAEFGGINYLELVSNKISQTTGIENEKIHIITPDIYSVYKRMGKKKVPTLADCYLIVDVDLDSERSMEWLKKAWNHRFDLAMSEDFNSTVSMDLEDIYDKFINNRLYSLEFFMDASFGLEIPLKINLYPRQGYNLMQIPIADFYYHRLGIDSYNKDEKVIKERGLQKWQYIKNRLNVGPEDLEGGELGRKFLDTILPGKVAFLISENGKLRSWDIDEGSSLLDVLIDKYPGTDPGVKESWMNAKLLTVNGLEADVNYIIEHGDEVNIDFSPRSEIKPYWIRAINTSSNEYIDSIRRYFRSRLFGYKWAEVAHQQLRQEAVKIISEFMGSELVVNIERSDNFRRLEMDPKEFIYRVALDEIESIDLLAIAGDLREYQRRNLVLATFYFKRDDLGLAELVTHVFTSKGINKRTISGTAGISKEDKPSISYAIDLGEIYRKENDYPKIIKLLEEIIEEIRVSKPALVNPYIIYPSTIKI